MQILKYRSICG